MANTNGHDRNTDTTSRLQDAKALWTKHKRARFVLAMLLMGAWLWGFSAFTDPDKASAAPAPVSHTVPAQVSTIR